MSMSDNEGIDITRKIQCFRCNGFILIDDSGPSIKVFKQGTLIQHHDYIISCPYCNTKFVTNLLEGQPTAKMVYFCSVCKYTSIRSPNVKRHIQKMLYNKCKVLQINEEK